MPAGASAPVMPARASSVGEMSTFVAGAAHSDPGLIPGPRATTAQVPGSQNPKVHGQQKEGTGRTVDPNVEVVHVALVLGQVQLAELEAVITRIEEVSIVRLPELVDGLDRVLDRVVDGH